MPARVTAILIPILLAALLVCLAAGWTLGTSARRATAGGPTAGGPAISSAAAEATAATNATATTGRTAAPAPAPPPPGPLAAAGRLLQRPPTPSSFAAGPALTCATARAAGVLRLARVLGCARTTLAPTGRPVLWATGRTGGGRLQMQVWALTAPTRWSKVLQASEPAERAWARAQVLTPQLVRSARTLVAAVTLAGPDRELAYDIVRWPGGSLPVVAVHRGGLEQGAIDFPALATGGRGIDDYAASAGGTRFVRTEIRFVGGAYRALRTGIVSASAVPRAATPTGEAG